MRQKIVKKILATVLIMVLMCSSIITVEAATPSLSTSKYMKTYVLSTGNNTYVYTDTSLKTRGTSSPYRAYNSCIYAGDEVYVYSMNNTYAYVSYPVTGGRRYGYIKTSSITSNNYSRDAKKSTGKMTTYRRAGATQYGYVAKGDTVYTVASSGNYKQVIYPAGNTWKMGWVSNSDYNKYVEGSGGGYNPQGCLDSVASTASNQIQVSGWAFDRDSLGSNLAIHVYVGGAAGTGAPGYAITANARRDDVNKAYPGVGNYHGFSSKISVSRTGKQTIYVYAINVGSGNNVLLGTRTVTIASSGGNGNNDNNNTTDKRTQLVNYALSQVGVGDKKGNNDVVYNTWYWNRRINGSGYAWCQAFVSYCANQTGLLNNSIPKTASCPTAVKWYTDRGKFYKSQYYGGNYTPKAGDLVFYTNRGTTADHVGIIIAAPVNGYLQVVEGNVYCNDGNYKVVKFTGNTKRTVGSSYVMGYGVY